MSDNFRVDIPFETRPPRLKDLINHHVMGDGWVRDTPFGPVTDSLKIAEKFEIDHKNVCGRSINVRRSLERSSNLSYVKIL